MKFVELPTFQRHQYQAIPDVDDIEGDSTHTVQTNNPSLSTQDVKDASIQRKKRLLMLAALLLSFLATCVLLLYHSDLSNSTSTAIRDYLQVPSPPASTSTSALSKNTPYRSVAHPDPPTALWGNVVKPFPTGAFWTNLVVKEGKMTVGVYPYGVKTLEEGIQISYGAYRRRVSDTKITDPFDIDLQLTSKEDYLSRHVDSYDNVSVTMTYQTANNGQFKTHLVKSSPFVTVVYNGATPVLNSPVIKILTAERRTAENNATIKGAIYLLTLGHYQRWLLYCSDPNALVWDSSSNTFSATGPLRGVIRLAVLPLESYELSLQALLPYVGRYPTGGVVSFSYPSVSSAVMNIQYQAEGEGSLLMFALPHHIPLLPTSFVDNEESKALHELYGTIFCTKGRLKPVVGENWKLSYALPAIGWNYGLMDRLSTAQLDEIAMNLITEVRQILPLAVDPYMFGKEMGRMARLALIADNLGISDARQEAISTLETSIIPWLQGMNHDILLYDQSYGGLVTTYGIADSGNDFGQGWYSDHHFHYGYFANVVAVLAKLDLPFYEANKAALDAFLRDICNSDNADLDYPFARHKDLFDGHSWASGLFEQANGKGQESSSEAVNAYYGCALYGLAIGNSDFQKFSQLLLASEIQATQFYWHMKSEEIYDSVFAANRMVGNVGALDVTVSTWFGDAIEYVHGINM